MGENKGVSRCWKLAETMNRWARRARREAHLAQAILQHPRTPRVVKWLAGALAVYVLSPIDFIPDFVPVLGLLDEAVVLPLGLYLLFRLTPADVIAECRARVS